MTTRTRSPRRPDGAEQLALLPTSSMPLQFRLDRATRERGLAHVAEIRRQLAAQAARSAGTGQRAA